MVKWLLLNLWWNDDNVNSYDDNNDAANYHNDINDAYDDDTDDTVNDDNDNDANSYHDDVNDTEWEYDAGKDCYTVHSHSPSCVVVVVSIWIDQDPVRLYLR